MRIWRNWQTRWFQVPVGDHAGSTPVIRTKKQPHFWARLFFYFCKDTTGVVGRQDRNSSFCRRSEDSTDDLTSLGLGCHVRRAQAATPVIRTKKNSITFG